MELDCLDSGKPQLHRSVGKVRHIREGVQEVPRRALSAALDILSGVSAHRLCLLSCDRGNARASDDDFFELNRLLFRSLFALLFCSRRARSLSLIHLSQAKSIEEALLFSLW